MLNSDSLAEDKTRASAVSMNEQKLELVQRVNILIHEQGFVQKTSQEEVAMIRRLEKSKC